MDIPPDHPTRPPLVALLTVALVAVAPLLAVRHRAAARRRARLWQAQQAWAERMERR